MSSAPISYDEATICALEEENADLLADNERLRAALKMQHPRLKWSIRPRFKEWREARNLTQKQVADRIGVTQPAVMKWETEQRRTSLALIARYANAFGQHPFQFISLEMHADFAAQDERRAAIDALLEEDGKLIFGDDA